jgi:uncharacterized damage-inducible protein DinB
LISKSASLKENLSGRRRGHARREVQFHSHHPQHPGSEYKTVKTFAEEVRHVAATNYLLWGAITGDKSPIPSTEDNGPSSLKTKAEIIKYLKDSFALGHKAAQSITAENAAALVPSPFGQGQTTKLFCATFSVAHAFDHYGQMVEYLRMNGIIAPASRGNN